MLMNINMHIYCNLVYICAYIYIYAYIYKIYTCRYEVFSNFILCSDFLGPEIRNNFTSKKAKKMIQ